MGVGWKKIKYDIDKVEALLNRISLKKSRLDDKRPLPTYALKSIKDSLSIEWSHNSTAIEGNSLTLQETKVVIEEGLTIGGKSLREHFEIINHEEAIDFIDLIVREDHHVEKRIILDLHQIVMRNIDRDYGGRYRTSGVRISGANFVPPDALKVDELMNDLLDWYKDDFGLNIIIQAAVFHHRFVWIHPFFDGNGRTVRLVMNLLLMNAGFPPAIILKNDRKKYYAALNAANKSDYTKFIILVGQAVERSLDIYLSALDDNYSDYQPISQIVEEPSVPYGQEYVSLLARKGKIDAFKEGRNWLTTRQAVLDYMDARKRHREVGK